MLRKTFQERTQKLQLRADLTKQSEAISLRLQGVNEDLKKLNVTIDTGLEAVTVKIRTDLRQVHSHNLHAENKDGFITVFQALGNVRNELLVIGKGNEGLEIVPGKGGYPQGNIETIKYYATKLQSILNLLS